MSSCPAVSTPQISIVWTPKNPKVSCIISEFHQIPIGSVWDIWYPIVQIIRCCSKAAIPSLILTPIFSQQQANLHTKAAPVILLTRPAWNQTPVRKSYSNKIQPHKTSLSALVQFTVGNNQRNWPFLIASTLGGRRWTIIAPWWGWGKQNGEIEMGNIKNCLTYLKQEHNKWLCVII